MTPFDITSIPDHIYVRIVETEDIAELMAMKKLYTSKKHTLVREAIGQRIENLRYHQKN